MDKTSDFFFPLALRMIPEIHHRQRLPYRWGDQLNRLAFNRREGRPQTLVPRDDLI